MLRITILGTGYVGLVSGVCLADMGHHVTCIDKDNRKISMLQDGQTPIYENGLALLLKKNIKHDHLKFSTALNDSLNTSDVIIIAVGTPIANEKTGDVNLSYINECVSEIAKYLSKDILVVVKSTVPIGTCDEIQKQLNEISKFECIVVSNPEFLREGNAVNDFMYPDRIIIGSDNRGREIIEQLFWKFIKDKKRFVLCDRRTAELIKYASNAFLAMKVAFVNEMADISQNVDADIKKLTEGIGSDKRIGSQFLNPGPSFGGSCFPKDVKALAQLMDVKNIKGHLVQSIIKSNKNRIEKISNTIMKSTKREGIITILGLTYKAGTDDVRDSPSIEIIKYLIDNGEYSIKTWDPFGMDNAESILGSKLEYCKNIDAACTNSSLVVIATEWEIFKTLDPMKLKKIMKLYNIYDLRNVIDRESFLKSGFNVSTIGYKSYVSRVYSS